MNELFDDPEIRAEMARLGIVHKPGMAKELMQQLAPLLAAEGIDLDDPEPDFSIDTLNAAMARATEQHNLLLATPVGGQRLSTLAMLRRFASAIADGDDALARELLASIGPEPDGDTPAISHVIGVSLGLLDTWFTDPSLQAALGATRPPRWQGRPARAAATDILALARKGRAFDSQQSLVMRHHGLAVYEGGCLAVAASVIARAAREGVAVDALAGRILVGDADASAWSPASAGPSRPGAAFQKPSAAEPLPPAWADHEVVRAFGAWLRGQPAIAAASADAAARVLEMLFRLARDMRLDPHEPDDVEELFFALHEDGEREGQLEPALDTIDDYLHFRIDTADDPEGWEEVHEIVGDVLVDASGAQEFRAAIERAIDDSLRLEPEEQREALERTRVVAAVSELLDWVGAGRPVTSTGGLRRADIQHVAGLLGISAIGVSKHPDLSRVEPGTIYSQSMWDVPVLAAWWEALLAADLIETTSTRVRPGAAAAQWSAAEPPLEAAEAVVGMFVAHVLNDESLLPMLAGSIAEGTVARLLRAIAPDGVETEETDERRDSDRTDEVESLFASIVAARAHRTLLELESVGLVQMEGDAATVPVGLRGVVARAILVSMALAAADAELE